MISPWHIITKIQRWGHPKYCRSCLYDRQVHNSKKRRYWFGNWKKDCRCSHWQSLRSREDCQDLQSKYSVDESSHEAKYNEELTESSDNVNFDSSSRSNDTAGMGTMSFGTSKKFFRGRMFAHKETRKTWSSKGDAMASKVIDYYSFDVKSIRNPIENLVN